MKRSEVSQLLAGTNLDGKTRRALDLIFDGIYAMFKGLESPDEPKTNVPASDVTAADVKQSTQEANDAAEKAAADQAESDKRAEAKQAKATQAASEVMAEPDEPKQSRAPAKAGKSAGAKK